MSAPEGRPIRRLFIANRGEIAMRIIRACRDLEIETVLGYSAADRASMPVQMCDRAICIGEGAASQSYLNVPSMLAAAVGTDCDAIHPGYGFLAENAAFADRCRSEGLIFVGPRAQTIALLGDKIAARSTAAAIGIPVIPGSPADVTDVTGAKEVAASVGYPILIKAGGGGGGKGLRRVADSDQLETALYAAKSEAAASSGNADVYIEKFIPRARHVEIQVVADQYGSVVSLGERDCSIQRSYQKLVEEAPSPVLDDDLRQRMSAAAIALVTHADYLGVGTVEFLFDQDRRTFYFMEMNTRLQVEHPVTELVTGLDLVALQITIAAGEPLPFQQRDIAPRGHAIEFRLNAEDPTAGFRPSAGKIDLWRAAAGPWVRTDTHCFSGYDVPPFYDSLLAKVIVFGPTREEAVARARRALDEFAVAGVTTTLDLHRWLLRNTEFLAGAFDTSWLERNWPLRSEA